MEKYLRIPLLFLFVGSAIGVLLRAQFIYPSPFVNYTNVLHAHSHIMFLGWVFNVLYIAFVVVFLGEKRTSRFRFIFLFLQALNIGMLIAFPLQGYGTYSIILSSIHTVLSFVFIAMYFNRVEKRGGQSVWLSKVALAFCALSALGPFSLAYIVANGLQNTDWYNYAVYFYLHFQYNGFFFFGIASLLVKWIEENAGVNPTPLKSTWLWLLAACFPTYFLSILYSHPGTIYNITGAVGAGIQLYAYAKVLHWINTNVVAIKQSFGDTFPFLRVIAAGLALKLILQLLSALPAIANMAYEFRPITIGYLHLVLLGVITSALLVWYRLMGLFTRTFKIILFIFLLAFVTMELVLISTPWWPDVFLVFSPVTPLLWTAVILSACCLGFAAIFKKRGLL